LVEAYRSRNGLEPAAAVPVDAVTRSGSGLDPHISPPNAALQLARVARFRHVSEPSVRRLLAEHTWGQQFGILGEPRVAVLSLNLALDQAAPSTPSTSTR
jgi:K+-transporting ATPase ATPase C chain